jgi:hypothetical protein
MPEWSFSALQADGVSSSGGRPEPGGAPGTEEHTAPAPDFPRRGRR